MPKPLEGIRVVDLSQITSGPFATMLMGEQGADVIKVEPLGIGDVMRRTAFSRGGFSALLLNHNRGKRSVAVDTATDDGRAIVGDLMAGADVVVQNFRPGVVDRLGLGYEAVRARNPRVIYVSISGFGPDGPYADRPVVDPIIQALTGIVARQQSEAIPLPDLVRNIFIDKATALMVAQAVCAALFRRSVTGEGDHIEIPMLDVGVYFYWPDGMMDLTLLGDGIMPGPRIADTYQLTDCADGRIIYYAATDGQRASLFVAVGHPEWSDDERFNSVAGLVTGDNFATLGRLLAAVFAELPVEAVLARLHQGQVPAAPILDAEQMFDDPQVRHNGTVVTWEHPDAGLLRQPRHPVRFDSAETPVPASAPGLGQHTDEVLAEIGRSPSAISDLRAAGVIN